MIREAVTADPLYWPPGWERSKRPTRSRFGDTTIYKEMRALGWEMDRLGAHPRNRIVSTNLRLRNDGLPYSKQSRVEDQGVSVWFDLAGEERVLACDRWDRIEHNMRAIHKHIDAIRAQARWGVGSLAQAFAGFMALPEQASGRGYRDILGIGPDERLTAELVDERFRKRALVVHPDQGGATEDWHELAMARKRAMEAVG